jgi:hypothetical protein
MVDVRTLKFRHNAAITIASIVAFLGAVPLATSRAYLLPILLVPALVGVWAWRAGTDISPGGLRVRALFGSRLVPWSHVTALVPAHRHRVYAVLTTGRQVRLPAVGKADLATISDDPGGPGGQAATDHDSGREATGHDSGREATDQDKGQEATGHDSGQEATGHDSGQEATDDEGTGDSAKAQ